MKSILLAASLTLTLTNLCYGGAIGTLKDCQSLRVEIQTVNPTDEKARSRLAFNAVNFGKKSAPGDLMISTGLLAGPANAMSPSVAQVEIAPIEQIFNLCKEIDASYVLPPSSSSEAAKIEKESFTSVTIGINGWTMTTGETKANREPVRKLLKILKTHMPPEQSRIANSLFP